MQNGNAMQKIKNACGVSDTPCKIWLRMHNRRTIRRAWQSLKGISIKNIYDPELSYPTPKKIYKFKGAT
jgi:hypothetical protein